MLRIEEAKSRPYEERIEEAISLIPLLSKEWTNFNPSDPGITILENLTAFESLQGSSITELDYRSKLGLLKMAGFTPMKGKCARTLLSASSLEEPVEIRQNQRFKLGDMVFETKRKFMAGGCHLTGIFSKYDGKFHDHRYLSDREYKMPAAIFGEKPKSGDSIYFIADRLPEKGSETWFYIDIDDNIKRNPIEDRSKSMFAMTRWECYTAGGFKEMKVKGYTGAFLFSGEIRLNLPDEEAVIYDGAPIKGYCIRATLRDVLYDVRPRLLSVEAFLFEVWQKNTKALSYAFQNVKRLHVTSPLEDEGYVLVFAKEEKGSSYRRYELSLTGGQKGRFCFYERKEKGSFDIRFDRETFGFEPVKVKDAVRVVLYDEDVMRTYRIGKVLGYDDQEIELPFNHIVPESFVLLAKRNDGNGGEIFDFVRPGYRDRDALTFHLLENDGRIIIEDAGKFIGAELFIAGLAVTEGPKGNIRGGNHFSAPMLAKGELFYNPASATGGAFRETLADVRRRFREDVYTPYTCVTAEDYERTVLQTPGLCLKKARARMDEAENLIHIAVMPATDEEFPKLSPNYIKAIGERLTERRLLTTRYQIMQPFYVGVSVRCTAYVRRHFSNCKQRIEERLKQEIDYRSGERNFGETLKFEQVFRALEELDCVEYIYDLSMVPENRRRARMEDQNIIPAENCLLYPGGIEIEVITYGG
ncbi:MAG: baseplate J/gp47 family protein [Lachnospiraceae bacterium]|nr:baseplate J/gp47 family protein [Lachnospiraceae bacterium]